MPKKTFYLNFESGLDEQYVNWAKEAVQEFINLFPEYKSNFAVEENNFSYANVDVLKTIAEFNKELYQSRGKVFDEANFWRTFDRLPDGSYKASLQKQIALASRNGIIDIQKLSSLQADSMANKYGASSQILINITKQKAGGNIRGISSELSVNISAGTCAELGYKGDDLKSYFKDIIIHELGHSFNATHEGRKNCVENLGSHCTDKNCLMYEYAYTNESFNRRKKLKEPFCNDCMESMREYMQNFLKLERTNDNRQNRTEASVSNEQDFLSGLSDEEKAFLKDYLDYIRSSGIRRSKEDLLWDRVYLLEKFRSQRQSTNTAAQTLKQEFKTIAETFDWKKEEYKNKLPPQTRQKIETFLTQQAGQSIEINDQPLPPTAEKETSTLYKTQLRGILRDSARAEHLEYSEEPCKQGFKAELKAADGSKTTIEAANPRQVSLMAHNAKGEKVTPPFRRFMDIVSYAQLRHSSVSFGEIKTPEFKASLMIACLKAQPPVRMKGAPKMTEEFLNLLNPQTAKALHEAYYSRRIEKELPTYQGLKRSQAERYLQLKNQKEPLEQREWSELFYHEDQLVGDIALSDAQKKFKSERPREEEWHQKTGYAPQRVVHYEDKRPGDASWKLHLDVTPNPDEPTTKAITQYLEKLDMDYKICGGEENGKGITIYVGSYSDTLTLSTRLQMEFGDKAKLPARYTDQYNQETEFHNVATGRFMIAANYDPKTKTETPVFDEVYPTTVRGISPARLEEHNSTEFLIKAAKQMKLVTEQTPDDYKQITDAKQHYDIDMLENYVSHRLYAKHLGAFYYGDNAERFEKHLFNDKLPEAGSPERTKWDILANKYEQFIQNNCPEKIDLMKKHIENYKPIDFTKENTNQNSRQQKKPDLTQQVIYAKRKRMR